MKTHYYLKYVNNPLTDLLAEAIVFRRIMALKGYPSPKEMQLKDLKKYIEIFGKLDIVEQMMYDVDEIIREQYEDTLEELEQELEKYHSTDPKKILLDRELNKGDKSQTLTTIEDSKNIHELAPHYEEAIEAWFDTKTADQQEVWEHYNKGMPKKIIARKLQKDPRYIRATIENMEKDFQEKISLV